MIYNGEGSVSEKKVDERKELISLHKRLAELRIERIEQMVEQDYAQRINDFIRTKKARRRLVELEIEIGQTESMIQTIEFALLKRLLKERGCPTP